MYNSTNGYIDFFLAALIMHSVQIAVVFAIAPQIVSQKRLLFESPTRQLIMLLIEFSAIMIAVMLICLSIGLSMFEMVCRSDWLSIFLMISAFIICVVSFALCIGSWINEELLSTFFFTFAILGVNFNAEKFKT